MKNSIKIAETDRLILRKYRESDLQDLYEYLSDPVVVKYEPYRPMSLDETADNLAWRISADEMIAVELKHSGKMIGNVYLGKRGFDSLEIGYVFNRSYWGKRKHRIGYQRGNVGDSGAAFWLTGGVSNHEHSTDEVRGYQSLC